MNYRFVIPLLTTAFFEQVCVSMVRVTTSYRAVELGLSVVWLGVITAAFAILPMVTAVKIGRFVDRGNDARTAWIGGVLQIVACAGLALSQTLTALLVCTALLGISHLMLVISQQVLCTRLKGPGAMERMLGNYMVANAVGQGVGPYVVGWAGGTASIPPTQLLFWIALATAVATCISAWMLRPGRPATPRAEGRKPIPILDIARIPGLPVIFFLSVVTVAAQDLIVVYLPVLGAERGMPVDDIGMLLAVRAVASMFSRLLFARLNQWLGRTRLMVWSTFIGAAAYGALAAPLPLILMHAAIAAAGFAMGVSITVSIAALLALATAEARGTANSLRMMGNRMGQFVIPFMAGLLASATGAAGIFLAIGASLTAAATVAQLRRLGHAQDDAGPGEETPSA
jgi:MFS family permease